MSKIISLTLENSLSTFCGKNKLRRRYLQCFEEKFINKMKPVATKDPKEYSRFSKILD